MVCTTRVPPVLLLLLLLVARSGLVEAELAYHNQQAEEQHPEHHPQERRLHHGRYGRGKGGKGKGGKGKGGRVTRSGRGQRRRSSSRSGRRGFIQNTDDFFAGDDDFLGGGPGHGHPGPGGFIGSAIGQVERPAFRGTGIGRLDDRPDIDRPTRGTGFVTRRPYPGTGIGHLDRDRAPDGFPPRRPARGFIANRFPPGFRANTIRPTPPPGPTTLAPSLPPPLPTLPPTQPPGPGVTAAPSVPTTPGTAAPTVTPATLAPTVAGATIAPTVLATAAPNNDFIIESTFALTYFSGQPGDVDRDLTAEEYAELETLMDEFYRDAFLADPAFATDFISYSTDITTMNYTPGGYAC